MDMLKYKTMERTQILIDLKVCIGTLYILNIVLIVKN